MKFFHPQSQIFSSNPQNFSQFNPLIFTSLWLTNKLSKMTQYLLKYSHTQALDYCLRWSRVKWCWWLLKENWGNENFFLSYFFFFFFHENVSYTTVSTRTSHFVFSRSCMFLVTQFQACWSRECEQKLFFVELRTTDNLFGCDLHLNLVLWMFRFSLDSFHTLNARAYAIFMYRMTLNVEMGFHKIWRRFEKNGRCRANGND